MFKEGFGIKKTCIAAGYTDLRNGIDGFASIIQSRFHLDPFDEGTLFLFCGEKVRSDQRLTMGRRRIPASLYAHRKRKILLARE